MYIWPTYERWGLCGAGGGEQHQPDRFAVTGPCNKRTRMLSALLAMMQPYPAHHTRAISVPGLHMKGGDFVVRG
jgi:hypothetical protein